MLLDFGKANWLNKARQQPDKVKTVLNKALTDGLMITFDAIRSKLDQPIPLGYCNAGVVIESNNDSFDYGDRVVSNGCHAEVVRVPKNLCVKIPDNVDDESASFTVLGSVGLQGVRLIKPTIGECFVITGLGLIGLMSIQILRANGCRVLGIDYDSKKCALAKKFGASTVDLSKMEDPIGVANQFSRGRGVDGVLITAASQSDKIVHQSAEMCRKRGRIILVGIAGLNLRRDDFYKKELSFQVSSSYGPGRYDPNYEDKGNDYPIGFVRWTEQRNFEAVLDMMSSGALDVKPLISDRFEIENAVDAYSLLHNSQPLGIIINYPDKSIDSLTKTHVELNHKIFEDSSPKISSVGFIGAGNYASRTLIPAFKNAGAILDTLVTSGGFSGVHNGKKYDFFKASTDINDLLKNEVINTIAIATRHNNHAKQVTDGLSYNKNIFVEKPLALSLDELDEINDAYQQANKAQVTRLMVGFNRRFAPHVIKMKELLESHQLPKSIIITVNAGCIPKDHWTQDSLVGGGRLIGEGCHFIDLIRFLVGHKITKFSSTMMGDSPGLEIRNDKFSITLSFDDGSFGTIHYLANGGSSFPKERIEVFCNNAVLQLNNYRSLVGFGWPGFKKMKLFKQDKGQKACVKAFIKSIANGEKSPIPYNEIMEISRVSIEVANSLKD
jgi:predicted dehydrogenase/threonine dehydrogenase-like Zn-dependent dehydrogenase